MRRIELVFGFGVIGLFASVQVFAHGLEESGEMRILEGMDECRSERQQTRRVDCFISLCGESVDRACVDALLETATELGGPREGTATLHDIMTVQDRFGMRTDGHDLIHIVGRQAAKHFGINGEVFSQCSRDFFYGCEHGFFEVALAESDSPVDAANQVCGTRPVGHKFVCYHGVGHGLMMAYANDVMKAIETCDNMPKDELQDQGCWQGVFMENINANIRGEARKGVFSDKDPLAPCSTLHPKLHRECYINHAARLMQVFQNSLEDSAQSCMKEKNPTGRDACLEGLGQLTTNPGWQQVITGQQYKGSDFLRSAWELCGRYPKNHQTICYTAAAGNLLNYDDAALAVQFCEGVPQSAYQACQEKILREISRPIFPAEGRAIACRGLADDLRAQCGGGDEVRASDAVVENEKSTFGRIVSVVQRFFRFLLSFIAAPEPVFEDRPTLGAPRFKASMSSVSSEEISGIVIRRIGQEFEPSTLTITKGETVTWVNDTDDYIWPASDVHPTHELYPDFDAGKPLKSGASWSFTFNETGTWTFHDHLTPEALGTVTVR